MKCDELKPIELECNMGKDINGVEHREPWKAYDIDEVDAAIAELKDKVKLCSDFELASRKDIEEMREQHQMLKQFGHYKLSPVPGEMINHEVRQYVSYNVVCMIINHLESENAELKQMLEDAKATAYAESVDAGMRERRLKEERLWRKFSEEKPSEEMEGEDFLVSNGYYSVVCEWRGYWNNEPFCGDKNCDVVKYWMPLPSVPKEASK